MIQGLKLTVSGSEVQSLLAARAVATRDELAKAKARIGRLRESAVPIEDSQERAIETLERRLNYETFLASHTEVGETYLIDHRDLESLGVIREYECF